jgi:glycosyltransferase involved in cell wall biosynthesis
MFSIIIPTFNSAEKLEKAVQSVLNQTYTNFEVLIMDDGSTDQTKEMVRSFQDTRIKYDWSKNSGGPAIPRNRGIQIAQFDWICFLDADDRWESNKLEICENNISDKVDLIYHNLIQIDGDNKVGPLIKSRVLKAPVIKSLLIYGNCISNSSVVVRKSLLESVGGVNPSTQMVASEDYNTWLKIANLTDKFLFIDKNLGYYLEDSSGISSKKNMALCHLAAKSDFLNLLSYQELKKANAVTNYIESRYQYVAGTYDRIKSKLWYCFFNGHFMLRIKSFYMLISVILRQIKN